MQRDIFFLGRDTVREDQVDGGDRGDVDKRGPGGDAHHDGGRGHRGDPQLSVHRDGGRGHRGERPGGP